MTRLEATQQRREEYERCRLVLVRESRPCKVCRRAVATEVHYQTWGHVGSEPKWELRAVCRACHARLHPEDKLADLPVAAWSRVWHARLHPEEDR